MKQTDLFDALRGKGYVQDAKGTWYKPQRDWSATQQEKAIDNLCQPQNAPLLGIPHKPLWKAGNRLIGRRKIYFRSGWEANYARYLEWLRARGQIAKWDYEPETFWFDGIKRGCVSYKPDFRVAENNGQVEYHEVKGWLDPQSKIKLKRMAKYHPDVKIRLIQRDWFVNNRDQLRRLIPDWETYSYKEPAPVKGRVTRPT